MHIVCPKCNKTIKLAPEKMPVDKEKAMVTCPCCQQVINFTVPKVKIKPVFQGEERTIIDTLSSKPRVAVLLDKEKNREYILKPGKNILGRKSDICLDDPYLSRNHCFIEVTIRNNVTEAVLCDDGSISDNGQPSTNGTYHNEVRITKFDKIVLKENDLISLGHTDLVFCFRKS